MTLNRKILSAIKKKNYYSQPLMKNKRLYDLCKNQFCVKIVYYTTMEVKSYPHVAYTIFHHTRAENTTGKMLVFRIKIVYYTPREEKT